jgi:hypothetical protein
MKIGKRLIIDLRDVDAYMERLKKEAQPSHDRQDESESQTR